MNSWIFYLPFPPSQNHYYRRVGHSVKISKRGREYRKEVLEALDEQRLSNEGIKSRISVSIAMNPSSNHRRDLDNFLKVPLDAITKAGFWIDDSQIDSLKIVRGGKSKLGNLEIEVRELENV